LIIWNPYFRILTTPSERVWKGLEKMPEFKGKFPKWEVDCLDQKMKDGEFGKSGMRLLRVSGFQELIVQSHWHSLVCLGYAPV